jgi:hypothetical protein
LRVQDDGDNAGDQLSESEEQVREDDDLLAAGVLREILELHLEEHLA